MTSRTPSHPIWAVIPVKETAHAKQRLSARLCPKDRHDLVCAMFEDVLCAVAMVDELAGVIVVTADTEVAAIARMHGALVSAAAAREGLNEAIASAAFEIAIRNHGMLALPADIPLVTAADIRSLLLHHGSGRAFTIVPAHDYRGTNALVVSPADVVSTQFGENSFHQHLSQAREAGISPHIFRCARIELDIDTLADLRALQADRPSHRVARLLTDWTNRETVLFEASR